MELLGVVAELLGSPGHQGIDGRLDLPCFGEDQGVHRPGQLQLQHSILTSVTVSRKRLR
jgi:hypothetical protein